VNEQPIKPCAHLKDWVSAFADGTLRGFARLYLRLHMLHCEHCRTAVQALRALCERLRGLQNSASTVSGVELTPERRASLSADLDRLDQAKDG
jgi:hypothetical protein